MVRVKVNPPQQKNQACMRKFVSQKKAWRGLTRTEVTKAFAPPLVGMRQPVTPLHQLSFLDISFCFSEYSQALPLMADMRENSTASHSQALLPVEEEPLFGF